MAEVINRAALRLGADFSHAGEGTSEGAKPMIERVLDARIRKANKQLIREVENVSKTPPGEDIDQMKKQVALLAKLLVEVSHQCGDITEVLETITKTVVFKGQK
jgi:hypothetical protein